MEFLQKFWPTPFKIEKKNVTSFIVQLLVFVLICLVFGFLIGLLSQIPYVGFVFGLLGFLVEAYSLVGVVLCILKFIGVMD